MCLEMLILVNIKKRKHLSCYGLVTIALKGQQKKGGGVKYKVFGRRNGLQYKTNKNLSNYYITVLF